jgi:hypothetical protein
LRWKQRDSPVDLPAPQTHALPPRLPTLAKWRPRCSAWSVRCLF